MDRKMNADITNLTKMVAQLTHQNPDDSTLTYKSPMTERFLAVAEKGGRRWFSYGFDEWLRAGQWWLISSQGRLEPETSDNWIIPVQPYTNLLKASSIILDILPRHPSIRLWDPTKEYMQYQLLANVLREELETIEGRGLQKPALEALQGADLRIWMEAVNTIQLIPETNSQFWQNADEETLWQGFGTFKYDPEVKSEDCMILVLVGKKIEKARIVAQNQRGAELTSLRVDFDLLCVQNLLAEETRPMHGVENWGKQVSSFYEFYSPNCRKPLGDGLQTIRLGHVEFSLSSIRDLAEFSCVLRGIIFCQNIKGIRKDHALLHAMILLFLIVSGDVKSVKACAKVLCKRRCLESYDEYESSILQVAKIVAEEFVCNTDLFTTKMPHHLHDFGSVLADKDYLTSMVPTKNVAKEQSMIDWAYCIFAVPITLGVDLGSFQNASFLVLGECLSFLFALTISIAETI